MPRSPRRPVAYRADRLEPAPSSRRSPQKSTGCCARIRNISTPRVLVNCSRSKRGCWIRRPNKRGESTKSVVSNADRNLGTSNRRHSPRATTGRISSPRSACNAIQVSVADRVERRDAQVHHVLAITRRLGLRVRPPTCATYDAGTRGGATNRPVVLLRGDFFLAAAHDASSQGAIGCVKIGGNFGGCPLERMGGVS